MYPIFVLLCCLGIPKIKHSTFLRFKAPIENPSVMEAAFKKVQEKWKSVIVLTDKIGISLEDIPYMHIIPDDDHFIPLF